MINDKNQKVTRELSLSDYWKVKTIVSFFLSVLVFLIHISTFANYPGEDTPNKINSIISIFLQKTITPMAVPLFFIISGATLFRDFEPNMFIRKLKSRIFSLVIPYLIWNTIWLLFTIFISYTPISSFFTGREKIVISPLTIFLSIFHYQCNIPFWFIFDLIIFFLCAPIIYWILKSRITGLALIIGLIVLNQFGIGIPSIVFYNSTSIIYFLIGCYIGKFYFKYFANYNKESFFVCLGLLIACIVFYSFQNFLNFSLWSSGTVIVLFIYAISFWEFMKGLYANGVLKMKKFMKNSFAIYAMHINISAIITKILYLILPKNNWLACLNFFLTILLTLIVIHLICVILEKTAPKIDSVLFGKRNKQPKKIAQ